jgi:hypothetical protein
MTVKFVLERTTQYVNYEFLDSAGVLMGSAPNSARYRVDDVTSGTEVRAWTNISPLAASGVINIAPADMAILDEDNRTERRAVQVEATYGSDVKRGVVEIIVKNTLGVT